MKPSTLGRMRDTGSSQSSRTPPDAKCASVPHPTTRSVAELVQHIIESALMWSSELADPRGDFTRQDFSAFIKEHAGHVSRARTKAALLRLLESSHATGARQIRRAGEVGMLQHIRRFDGECWTRLTWMHPRHRPRGVPSCADSVVRSIDGADTRLDEVDSGRLALPRRRGLCHGLLLGTSFTEGVSGWRSFPHDRRTRKSPPCREWVS